ncbi:MAG: hypothetical protein JNK64_15160 [Myxococcales bacterium]|nr:hypothetical protein [Myxococcales bacterium]
MSYRDDRDADQARIAALEADLARAEAKIAELEGRRAVALVPAGGGALARATPGPSAAARWMGAPLRLELRREFAHAFPTDQFERLIERIRAVTGEPGRSELLRSSLTWSATSSDRGTGPFITVMVMVRPPAPGADPGTGRTTLTVSDRLGQLAGAVFGGVGGGIGGGALVGPIAAAAGARAGVRAGLARRRLRPDPRALPPRRPPPRRGGAAAVRRAGRGAHAGAAALSARRR